MRQIGRKKTDTEKLAARPIEEITVSELNKSTCYPEDYVWYCEKHSMLFEGDDKVKAIITGTKYREVLCPLGRNEKTFFGIWPFRKERTNAVLCKARLTCGELKYFSDNYHFNPSL